MKENNIIPEKGILFVCNACEEGLGNLKGTRQIFKDYEVSYKSSSTDCNIPLSLGIPALCIGVNNFEGVHTREEYLDKKTVIKGLEIAIKTALKFM